MTASHDIRSYKVQNEIPPPKFRWATRIAFPVGLLVLFGGVFASSISQSLSPAISVEAIPVVERPAIDRVVEVSNVSDQETVAQSAGWIEPAPFPVFASTLIDGTVEDVFFLEGDRVEQGQLLVRLVGDDARLSLDRAEAEHRAAQEAWESNIEARREAAVRLAQEQETLAALKLARAELEVEEALADDAIRIYERRRSLVEGGSIAQENHDSALANSIAQSARVRVIKARIDELEARTEQAEAERIAAEENLELRTEERLRLDLAEVALREAQLRVTRLEINAPMDGVIMRRLVEPGATLMTFSDNPMMAHIAKVYDPEKLQVRVDVPLADAAKIGVGQKAEVMIEVLPEQSFSGMVTRVTHFADIQKNTLEVKVALENPAPELRPEMLARVRFFGVSISPENEDASSVQTTRGLSVFAPSQTVSGETVWVVSDYDGREGIAEERAITLTGAEFEGWKEIGSGLRPGDLLILANGRTFESNQRVRVQEGGTE